MRGGKHFAPSININDALSHGPPSGRQSWAKYTQIGSGNSDYTNNQIELFPSQNLDPEESMTK